MLPTKARVGCFQMMSLYRSSDDVFAQSVESPPLMGSYGMRPKSIGRLLKSFVLLDALSNKVISSTNPLFI